MSGDPEISPLSGTADGGRRVGGGSGGILYQKNPELVIVTDEIGCGIVPMDPFQREVREQSGRVCTALAGKARRVHRVICGIGTVNAPGLPCKRRADPPGLLPYFPLEGSIGHDTAADLIGHDHQLRILLIQNFRQIRHDSPAAIRRSR